MRVCLQCQLCYDDKSPVVQKSPNSKTRDGDRGMIAGYQWNLMGLGKSDFTVPARWRRAGP